MDGKSFKHDHFCEILIINTIFDRNYYKSSSIIDNNGTDHASVLNVNGIVVDYGMNGKITIKNTTFIGKPSIINENREFTIEMDDNTKMIDVFNDQSNIQSILSKQRKTLHLSKRTNQNSKLSVIQSQMRWNDILSIDNGTYIVDKPIQLKYIAISPSFLVSNYTIVGNGSTSTQLVWKQTKNHQLIELETPTLDKKYYQSYSLQFDNIEQLTQQSQLVLQNLNIVVVCNVTYTKSLQPKSSVSNKNYNIFDNSVRGVIKSLMVSLHDMSNIFFENITIINNSTKVSINNNTNTTARDRLIYYIYDRYFGINTMIGPYGSNSWFYDDNRRYYNYKLLGWTGVNFFQLRMTNIRFFYQVAMALGEKYGQRITFLQANNGDIVRLNNIEFNIPIMSKLWIGLNLINNVYISKIKSNSTQMAFFYIKINARSEDAEKFHFEDIFVNGLISMYLNHGCNVTFDNIAINNSNMVQVTKYFDPKNPNRTAMQNTAFDIMDRIDYGLFTIDASSLIINNLNVSNIIPTTKHMVCLEDENSMYRQDSAMFELSQSTMQNGCSKTTVFKKEIFNAKFFNVITNNFLFKINSEYVNLTNISIDKDVEINVFDYYSYKSTNCDLNLHAAIVSGNIILTNIWINNFDFSDSLFILHGKKNISLNSIIINGMSGGEFVNIAKCQGRCNVVLNNIIVNGARGIDNINNTLSTLTKPIILLGDTLYNYGIFTPKNEIQNSIFSNYMVVDSKQNNTNFNNGAVNSVIQIQSNTIKNVTFSNINYNLSKHESWNINSSKSFVINIDFNTAILHNISFNNCMFKNVKNFSSVIGIMPRRKDYSVYISRTNTFGRKLPKPPVHYCNITIKNSTFYDTNVNHLISLQSFGYLTWITGMYSPRIHQCIWTIEIQYCKFIISNSNTTLNLTNQKHWHSHWQNINNIVTFEKGDFDDDFEIYNLTNVPEFRIIISDLSYVMLNGSYATDEQDNQSDNYNVTMRTHDHDYINASEKMATLMDMDTNNQLPQVNESVNLIPQYFDKYQSIFLWYSELTLIGGAAAVFICCLIVLILQKYNSKCLNYCQQC